MPLFLFLFLFLFLSGWLSAQNTTAHYLSRTTEQNPAALALSIPEEFSAAAAGYSTTGGSLRNIYHPASTHIYSVSTSSYRRFHRVYLYGRAEYSGEIRNGQQYSGMFRPAEPVITIADSIPGRRKGETYGLSGIIAVPVNPRWTAGMAIHYLSGNGAKDTDPRNSNGINELILAPGVTFSAGNFNIGIHFSWQRARESAIYASFGQEIKNGLTFYPLWLSKSETFGDGTNSNRAYDRNNYTFGLLTRYRSKRWESIFQPSFTSGKEAIWINRSLRRSGGEITRRSFRLTNHTTYSGVRTTQQFIPFISCSRTSGEELQQQTRPQELIYETYLKIKRSQTDATEAGADYSITLPRGNGNRKLTAGCRYEHRRTLFRIFPKDYIQTISRVHLSAGCEQDIFSSSAISGHLLRGGFRLHYLSGSGHQPDLSDISGQTIFKANPGLIDAEYRFLTSPAAGAAISLCYSCPLKKPSLSLFSKAEGCFRHSVGNTLSGQSNYTVNFCFGVRF